LPSIGFDYDREGKIMSESHDEPTPQTDDIDSLLKYTGPSLLQPHPIPGGVDLFNFRNSENNERNVPILLSARGISFTIQHWGPTWDRSQTRMIVTVTSSRVDEAIHILNAAAKVGAVEIVPGTEEIIAY
jgi:hypothetical protein